MTSKSAETKMAKIAAFGAVLITIFVLTRNVSDPVNAPKFFLLGTFACGLFFVAIMRGAIFKDSKFHLYLNLSLLVFVCWSTVAALQSDSPMSQNLYGVYGRNTGLLTYLFLAIWTFSLSRLRDLNSIKLIIWGFLFAGLINVMYCCWVVVFGDFIGWNNPYKAILGTFGNPNFISSFLGIFFSCSLAFVLVKKHPLRWILALSLPVTMFLLTRAESIQGIIVLLVGSWLVLVYYLFTSISRKVYSFLLLLTGILFSFLALWGVAGNGPLAKILAQPTIAFREQYWYAAWKIGISQPFFGVGMDSYGDWYRRMRGQGAITSPGLNVATNAAHNVYLDVLAYGGFPLLISYTLITLIGFLAIIKVLRKNEKFEPIFASASAIWALYQLQSLISINQIGLAIWGWTATGLLVSFAGMEKDNRAGKLIPKEQFKFLDPGTRIFLGLVVGALLSVPPLSADMKWMKALQSQKVELMKESLAGDYLSPHNSKILAQAVLTLERSGLHDLAIQYARLGVAFNPNYDDAWETLYYLKKSTPDEKRTARQKLILLDPLNPEWKKLS